MNTELLKRWVAALRSGEYEQGRGALKVTDADTGITKYCCLGVLQHIEPSIPPNMGGLNHHDFIKAIDGFISQYDLVKMNDCGKTFPEIADYIERKYIINEDKT